ncbi:MAG TPA: hypothetical protein VKU19_12990 [Bryobacteraceae bacterium]|nr:hypothetical protein [Bryobacteraceae bacterium]
MIDEDQLRHRMQRIAELVQRLESAADANLRAQSKELMESVMDLHGEAFERVFTALRASGDAGQKILDGVAADPVVSSVLLLYGLHPLDFETRVRNAAARLRGVEVVSITGGAIRLRVRGVDHALTARSLKSEIEEALYAAAPDSTSLVIEGLEKFAPANFVPLEKVGHAG